MKYFAVLLVAAFLASAQAAGLDADKKATLQAAAKECISSSGVAEDLVLKAREKGEFAEDSKLEEYYLCMFKKVKLMNDAGEVQEDGVRAQLPSNVDKAKADALIAKCKAAKGDSPAKTALLLFKCFKENSTYTLL